MFDHILNACSIFIFKSLNLWPIQNNLIGKLTDLGLVFVAVHMPVFDLGDHDR